MKCEIIRDLLPSYVDGLTSEESNREITAHVAECAPCKEILEQMQEEMQTKEEKEGRKINPFRKFNRRMMSAVAVAVAVCIGVGGFGYKAFARGFAINPQEITMEPKLEGDIKQIVPPILKMSRKLQQDPEYLKTHPWFAYLKPLPKADQMWEGNKKIQ